MVMLMLMLLALSPALKNEPVRAIRWRRLEILTAAEVAESAAAAAVSIHTTEAKPRLIVAMRAVKRLGELCALKLPEKCVSQRCRPHLATKPTAREELLVAWWIDSSRSACLQTKAQTTAVGVGMAAVAV
jgi:hypothetical protein